MPANFTTRLPAILVCLSLLGGCASSSQSGQVYSRQGRKPAPVYPVRPPAGHSYPDSQDSAGSYPAASHVAPRPPANTAVASLLQQASQARANGDYARAQTLAERAQTLQPRDASSYLELSRIYQARGDAARSRQMALRGLSVADPADSGMQHALRSLSNP